MKSIGSVLTLILLIGLNGCGGDGDGNGGTAPSSTGRIVINPQPESIAAPWGITGPEGYSADGSGEIELSDMTPGSYSIVWGQVAGHDIPSGETKTLVAGRTITFTGIYTEHEEPTPPPGFVYIPPGTFMIGSPQDEPGRSLMEVQHQVTLTRGFYMATCEVTKQWWYEVMGGTPSTSQLPVHALSWDMAVQFCNALSVLEDLTPAYTIHGPDGDVTWNQAADGYRLPTSAEWEYACRAGTQTAFASGPITLPYNCELDPNLDLCGWFCGNRTVEEGSAEVALKQPNAWGLYDMHGNYWEWVWCGNRTYTTDPQVDPVTSPAPGASRMLRGGSLLFSAQYCRAAHLNSYWPDVVGYSYGFRPVRTVF